MTIINITYALVYKLESILVYYGEIIIIMYVRAVRWFYLLFNLEILQTICLLRKKKNFTNSRPLLFLLCLRTLILDPSGTIGLSFGYIPVI